MKTGKDRKAKRHVAKQVRNCVMYGTCFIRTDMMKIYQPLLKLIKDASKHTKRKILRGHLRAADAERKGAFVRFDYGRPEGKGMPSFHRGESMRSAPDEFRGPSI